MGEIVRGFQLNRPAELDGCLLVFPDPSESLSQADMSLCLLALEEYRLLASRPGLGHPCAILRVVVLVTVRFSQAGKGQRVMGVLLEGAIEDGYGLVDILRLQRILQVATTLEVIVEGRRLGCAVSGESLLLLRLEVDLEERKDTRNNLILHREGVRHPCRNRVGA